MKKSTLITISDILQNLDRVNKELYNDIELMNISEDEKAKIIDAIFVLSDKLERIKQTKINDLDEHININYIETTMRY